MKKRQFGLVLAIASIFGATAANAGIVNRVIDGDTLTIDNQSVEIFCIDAPEIDYPGGDNARNLLVQKAQVGSRLEVKIAATAGETIYAELINSRGENVALELLKQGVAVVDISYCVDPSYYQAQGEAKASRRGIWSESNPTMPWEWSQ